MAKLNRPDTKALLKCQLAVSQRSRNHAYRQLSGVHFLAATCTAPSSGDKEWSPDKRLFCWETQS